MVQNEMNAIENNVNTNDTASLNPMIQEAANQFKEQAASWWRSQEHRRLQGSGKDRAKTVEIQNRFLSLAEKGATTEDFRAAFNPASGWMSDFVADCWAKAQRAAKADPLGEHGLAHVLLQAEVNGDQSFFKDAVVLAAIWAARQIRNERVQAVAKATAEAQASKKVLSLFHSWEEGLEAWDSRATAKDSEVLRDLKILISRAQKTVRAELQTIKTEGSGSCALSKALLGRIADLKKEVKNSLTKSTLALKEGGTSIWKYEDPKGRSNPSDRKVGGTARQILDEALLQLSALQSKADRSLSAAQAAEGVKMIEW